ncbi:hypothetical protein HZR84_12660 [Hyphobacterium sp. CCMP332]|nr:hypothetical protein HZR84_12660 [Hyphobacterium sp. CCMP332]
MRNLFVLVIIAILMLSCQDTCDESDCSGRSALFSFRVLNSNGFDMVYELNQIDKDSIKVLGSNPGAISNLQKEISVKLFDTIPVFQFSVDNVHLRYLIRTITSDTTITDTLRTDYILDNSDCCGVELREFSATLNSEPLCEDCQPEDVYIIVRD